MERPRHIVNGEYQEIDIKKYDPNNALGNTENDYERDAPKHYHQFVDACLGKDQVSAPFFLCFSTNRDHTFRGYCRSFSK